MDAYPEYVVLDSKISLFVDDERRAVLVAAGEIDRFEMADMVYMAVAPLLGPSELENRLHREVEDGDLHMLAIAMRVDWGTLKMKNDHIMIGPSGQGAPITVCHLDGLIEASELSA